jgi:tyrosine-protein kinase Etk/Wzc
MNNKDIIQQESLSIDYFISLFKKNWLIISICMIVAILSAYLINKIILPVYNIEAMLLIKEDQNQPMAQAASQLFGNMGIYTGENTFQNKIQVLKSSPLIKNAINNLDLQVSYYNASGLNKQELYKNSPFIVVFNQNHPQPINVSFKIVILDTGKFHIKAQSKKVIIYSFITDNVVQILDKLKINETTAFNTDINSENYSFKLVLNKNFNLDEYKSHKFTFVIRNVPTLVKGLKEQIKVEPVSLETTVARITLKTTVPSKAVDLISSITNEYLTKDVNEKVHSAVKTIEYIDNQLGAIGDSLRNAEINLQQFRTSNQVIDISVQSGRVYDQLNELEQEKGNIMIRYKYYQYINEYFEKNKEISDLIAPSSMGIEDPLLNNMIQELTTLNSERVSLIENNQEKSPYLKQINIKIDNLKNTISENIKYIINTTEISLQEVNDNINSLNSEINKLPSTERRLLGYQREFNLNDAIYTFLLERRAEAQISKASYAPGAELIEMTDINGLDPISPKKKLNYLIALFLGFVLPFFLIRSKEIIENKISETTDINKLVNLPLLGKIYTNNKKIELVVQIFPKSHIAESFRILRTGLNYFVNSNGCSIILITSTYGQEGKSFISNNLSASLALSNKKTILLGFDLRKPKIFERFEISNDQGISTFLSKQSKIEDIIQHSNIENLDVIASGPIPPNPSELIASPRTGELFNFLKKTYDSIIVDTPPVGLLSDTYLLMDIADLNIFVVRQGQTPRREFVNVISDLKEKKIKNLCVVVNDFPLLRKSQYGYDYYDK